VTTLEIRRAKNALNEIFNAIFGYKWPYLWIDRSFFELPSLCMAIICSNRLIENQSIEFSNGNYFTSNEKNWVYMFFGAAMPATLLGIVDMSQWFIPHVIISLTDVCRSSEGGRCFSQSKASQSCSCSLVCGSCLA
jgi:hypothetical protein